MPYSSDGTRKKSSGLRPREVVGCPLIFSTADLPLSSTWAGACRVRRSQPSILELSIQRLESFGAVDNPASLYIVEPGLHGLAELLRLSPFSPYLPFPGGRVFGPKRNQVLQAIKCVESRRFARGRPIRHRAAGGSRVRVGHGQSPVDHLTCA